MKEKITVTIYVPPKHKKAVVEEVEMILLTPNYECGYEIKEGGNNDTGR